MARVVSAAGERMGSVTLTEFLLARIAEDEAAARDATAGPWWDQEAPPGLPQGVEAVSDHFAENLAILKHEAETPMRGHDPDGECCRAAIRNAESPAQPSEDD